MHHAITLDALRALDAIDRKGSFHAAAEILFKVPSALSYTIAKLETDLDIKLFDRSRQRARLTPAGRLLLEQGRELLRAAAAVEEAVKQVESGWETQLRIAQDTILPRITLLRLVQSFAQLDLRVTIDISEEVLGGTWDALVAGRCDLALGASGEPPVGIYECRLLGEVDFVFAVAPEHPLRWHEGPVDAAAVRAFPTIVIADSSLTGPLRSSGLLDSRQTIRVASAEAKIECHIMGIGVGFLPRHLAQRHLDSGELVAVECSIPRPKAPLYMAWRKDDRGRALAWFVNACSGVDWLT